MDGGYDPHQVQGRPAALQAMAQHLTRAECGARQDGEPSCRGYVRSLTLGATSSISKRRERCISEWSSGSWVMTSRCPKPPTSS
jgi:hypothetical protein